MLLKAVQTLTVPLPWAKATGKRVEVKVVETTKSSAEALALVLIQ